MPRNLSLNISVGALLDRSVGQTFKAATGTVGELGKEHRRLNQELRKVSAVRKYSDRLEQLRRQASEAGTVSDSLARRIRNAEARFSAAAADARRLGHNIDQIGEAENRLRRQIDRTNNALRLRQRLGSVGRGLRTGAGLAGRGATTAGLLTGTTFGAGLAAITYTNKLTAEQANLAAAVGLTRKEMAIWSGILEQAGLSGDNVVDMVEELNNKFGESKGLYEQTTAVRESMEILRLDFEKLKRLKPDQQFKEIIRAAQEIGGQRAMSAADMLMGGEASKIIGFLNSLNMPLAQLMSRFDRLYVGSQEGLEGAKAFGRAWTDLTFSLGQALQELTGIIGKELAPEMKGWAERMAAAFRDNRDQITEFSSTIGSTLAQLGTGLAELASNLPTIVQAMTEISKVIVRWFAPDEDRTPKHTQEELAEIQRLAREKREADQATPEQEAAAMAANYRRQAGSVNNDNRMTVNMVIQQQPGESSTELAEKVKTRVRTLRHPHEAAALYADPGTGA